MREMTRLDFARN